MTTPTFINIHDPSAIDSSKKKRKKHKNSRLGCLNCKKRRIKCGEELDICYNCMERNLVCNFIDLPESQKMKLKGWEQRKPQNMDTGDLEEEFQELKRQGYLFAAEKFDVDCSKLLNERPLPPEQTLCSTIDWEAEKSGESPSVSTSSSTSSSSSSSSLPLIPSPSVSSLSSSSRPKSKSAKRKPAIEPKPQFTVNPIYRVKPKSAYKQFAPTITPNMKYSPLPNSTYEPTLFRLNKLSRHKWFYEVLKSDELFVLCGEDDVEFAQYRRGLENWFQALIDYGFVSKISFHEDMTLCGSLILNQLSRPSRKNHCLNHDIDVLKKIVLSHKLTGLQLAQDVIDTINQPKTISSHQYLSAVHKIMAYSMVSLAASMFHEQDFKTLLAFVGGFISTSLSKQVILRFRTILQEDHMSNYSVYPVQLLRRIFPFIHSYYMRNVASLYVPNLNAGLVVEIYDDLVEFQVHVQDMISTEVLIHLHELRVFLDEMVINNKELFASYDPSRAISYSPGVLYTLLSKFTALYPPTGLYIFHNYGSLSVIERISQLYWLVINSLLDTMFPEVLYLFTIKFSGLVRFAGIDIRYQESILEDLDLLYKWQNPSLYDYLYRKTFYLTRCLSYVSYRWRVYDRNLVIKNPYPDTPLFSKVQLESRKLPFLKEEQITSLKQANIKYENYPRNDKHFIDDNSQAGLAKPCHRKYVEFIDEGFENNENRDLNYENVQSVLHRRFCGQFDIETFPLHLMKFSEYGLIKNIDFRPNLKNNNIRRLQMDEDFFEKNEIALNSFVSDWNGIVKHYISDENQSK
ncbi:hypothetical protein DASC09_053210 [Saccharomycopsis crataegensis]|uniref:Zn(2)-C6 fungal-type domain-containing protein n=1 Tax=Saccharomycopsis crataegensis TaxID=43959 RepID=A0AAV5QTY1_9ASCO|nr:hypothetical protein DASC09_053210 [Saccharomycopsis crataegensis]